jgi:ankyrin repeat protein
MDIHKCAENGDEAALSDALNSGVPADALDTEGQTPLMLAAASPKADVNILHMLLAHGADPNALTVPPERTPIDPSTRQQLEEELLGLDLSILAGSDRAPCARSVLSFAAQGATIDKLRVLLDADADARFVCAHGLYIVLRVFVGELTALVQ